MGLIGRLGDGPVALDTVILIHWIENHPQWAPRLAPVFRAIDRGEMRSYTSALTLAEVLVVPFRHGNVRLAEQYEAFLRRGRGLTLAPLDLQVLRGAAMLRARYSVRMPDALHLASALARGCTAFLTDDRRLPAIPGLRVVQLSR